MKYINVRLEIGAPPEKGTTRNVIIMGVLTTLTQAGYKADVEDPDEMDPSLDNSDQ